MSLTLRLRRKPRDGLDGDSDAKENSGDWYGEGEFKGEGDSPKKPIESRFA